MLKIYSDIGVRREKMLQFVTLKERGKVVVEVYED